MAIIYRCTLWFSIFNKFILKGTDHSQRLFYTHMDNTQNSLNSIQL